MGSREKRGSTCLFLRRLHFDELPSGGIPNVRGRVISKLSEQTKTSLGDAKVAGERAYGVAPR